MKARLLFYALLVFTVFAPASLQQNKGVLLATLQETCVTVGWANINADGTLQDACGEVTVAVDATGRRTLTPPAGALTAQVSIVEAFATRDSIDSRLEGFLGQTIHLTEGDNGTAANTPRDRAFTIVWFGIEKRPTNLAAVLDGETKLVNCSEFCEASFTQDDIHPNDGGGTAPNAQAANFASDTMEGSWSRAGATITYGGQAKVITLDINMRAQDTGASNYWAKPILRVTEQVSGRVFWLEELEMQDNTAYDGSVYYDGSFRHLNPPANPRYLFEWFNEENRTATLTPDEDGVIVFEALIPRSAVVLPSP